jgi:FKBP-type peptidyl-prolyl cis-trans isomerase
MRRSIIKTLLLVSVTTGLLNLIRCNKHSGFEKRGSEIHLRLDKFGDCGTTIRDASHFIMLVRFESMDESNKKYEFQLHHGNPGASSSSNNAEKINEELEEILLNLNCGDAITLRLPFHTFANSYLSAYADETMFKPEEKIELSLEVLHTFLTGEYANFLMSATQQGELEENEAIELLLMNDGVRDYEKHGDCFIQYFSHTNGDTLKVGDEVKLTYNTYLLNGKKLDDETEMLLSYGAPGQLVDGLHYALSFMRYGEEAFVYLPSNLAFGTNGSGGNVVPRNTPVCFRVKLSEPGI